MSEHHTSVRDRMAICLPPLLLRLVLAGTFIWAGYGDLLRNRRYSPQDAAVLAELGVIKPSTDTSGGDAAPPQSSDEDNQAGIWDEQYRLVKIQNDDAAQQADEPAVEEATPDSVQDAAENAADAAEDHAKAAHAAASRTYTEADFPHGAEELGKYRIAIRIYNSVNPDGGKSRLPASLASGHWPKTLATTAGVVEFIGGIFLLIGLLTRLSALLLACTQVAALWMTYIAPNIIGGATDSFLGVLPHLDYVDPVSRGTWETMLWRFALLAACLALAFARPGFGMDSRLIFKPREKHPRIDPDD